MGRQSSKIRVGVVGTGVIATTVHVPVLQNIEGVEIAWVADAAYSRAMKVASVVGSRPVNAQDIETAIKDCDVVLLAIPLMPRSHYFDMLSDKPVAVLSEKPLSLNAGDHRKYSGLFGDARLSICFQRRFHATSMLLRRVIDNQMFGVPSIIRVAEGARTARTGGGGTYQDESREKGGGITLNLACHALDCVIWITRATGYVIRKREIEWDGDTDRRLRAEIILQGLGGKRGPDTLLDIIVSNLDTMPNTMEFEFERLVTRCPIVASDRCEFIVNGAPTGLCMCSSQGATSALESFYQLWMNVLVSHREARPSVVSASSSILMAELMDELLRP